VPERPRRRLRQYKIQEVIKRRQIILVQVVKEERGNKGAALTTYISLAGRYTVLMPNTGRGGGISRKITQPQDRKRLKAIAEELDVAEGMGLIIRTAGAARTKQEIKRDYEYLLRLWESVRDLTLSSTAPCLVYEEGNLIKRSIRDLYSKDIDDIFVSGEGAHREARDFMTMLMPGHGDNVQRYDGSEPLFTRFGIERQLNALFSPFVTLRSGGYIVINQTEALVSVDVNSGKATREFSIEETALNTNIEAAEEIARQLKLRDLAGLIVIDFIDMEEKRNNRNVERRLKDALRHDRARIQVGRISHFGLLEMSRQRLRTGVLEGSTSQCPHCQGTGIIRSTESVALAVLRGLEDNLLKQPSSLSAVTTSEVAIYILNHKRAFINEMERRHGISITIDASGRMHGANFAIERVASKATAPRREGRGGAVSMDWGFDGDEPADDDRREGEHRDDGDETREEAEGYEERRGRADRDEDREGGEEGRSTRRRRRRRGRRDREEGQGDDRPVNGDAPRSAARDAEDSGWSDRPEQAGPRDEVVADEEPVQARSGGAAAEAEDRGHREAGAREQGEDADRSRRGRRRGRRGGRGRGRDERPRAGGDAAGSSNGGEGGWGIAEIAKPGAEQPQGPEAALATRWDDGYSQAPRAAVAGNDAGRHERALVAGGVAGGDLDAAPAYEPVIERVPIIESPPQTEAPLEPERREARLPEPVGEPPARAAEPALVAETHTPAPAEPAEDPSRPARKGWWQRRFGGA
jgi:ribonuclease E